METPLLEEIAANRDAATLSFSAISQLGQGIATAAIIPICENDIQSCSFDLRVKVSTTAGVIVIIPLNKYLT